MTDKPPFGFRQDVEEKPEPPADDKQQEVSCTSVHESKAWSGMYAAVPASPSDAPHWRY